MGSGGFFVIYCYVDSGSLEALGIAIPAGAGTPEELAEREVQTRLATMDATGVDQAVLIPGHGYIRADGLADTRRDSHRIAAAPDRLPSPSPAAIGVIEPMYGALGLDEVQRVK